MDPVVAITGIGVVSPIGIGRQSFAANLVKGISGIGPLTLFDTSRRRSHFAAELSAPLPLEFLKGFNFRSFNRIQLLATCAAKLALDDGQLPKGFYGKTEMGVVLGSTYGYVQSVSKFYRESLVEGPNYVSPLDFANTVMNAPAGRVATVFQLTGPNATLATGELSSHDALIYAADLIRDGRASAVVAGGVLSLSEELYHGFHEVGLLSPGFDNDPELCAPFDKRHNGIVLGEGAAMFFLEELSKARERGASIYAIISGSGKAFDPSGRAREGGLHQAMATALTDAKLEKGAISYISAGANSSPEMDRLESIAIHRFLGKGADRIPVSAGKSAWGECLDASGAMQVASAIIAMREGLIPPTLNFESPDPVCDVWVVNQGTYRAKVHHVLINGLSCTGNAVAIVISESEALG